MMTRLKDIVLGSLLALAIFVPGLAKADPVTVERPRFSDKIEGSGPDLVFIPGLASSRATNEDCYAMARMIRAAIGTNNIDNCSRVCHSPTSFAMRRAAPSAEGSR